MISVMPDVVIHTTSETAVPVPCSAWSPRELRGHHAWNPHGFILKKKSIVAYVLFRLVESLGTAVSSAKYAIKIIVNIRNVTAEGK